MAWAPPEVAAAAPSWTPPEVVGAPAASGSDEAAAEGNPSDPYAGASTGASEAALSQATGALASIPAGVDYLTRRVGHLLAGGLGYGLAAGDPQKTQQMTDWLQQKATEDTCSFNDIQRFWTYAPTTPEGQAANASVGTALGQLTRPTRDVLSDVGVPSSITSKIPLPGPGTETALDIAGGALRASAALPVIGEIPHVPGLISDARAAQAAARAAKGADLGTTPMAGTSPRAPGTPLTGADLTAAPNPIPPPKPKITPKAGESAQAAAARQGILPEPPASSAAPAATPTPTAAPAATPARTFAPPSEEGPQPTATPNEQGARRQQLANLNQLAGGTLPNVRNSALTSDYTATGNDFQAAKTGSPTMQAQIATENDALQAAASNVHDAVGSTARDSVDTETLEQRGAAVRSAYQQIRDFFQGATNGLYDSARQMSGNNAIPQLGRVSAILGDDSEFASTDAIALQRAAQSRLTRLWSTGDPAGNVPPGSVAAAERFREFLNEQWSPGTSNLIGKLKDATDLDVAEHGGAGLFQAARNMRAHQARLLEDNPVVAKIIDRDNPVPVEKVMDHLTNAPREQFTDAVNTLRASAHLGGGELADPAAAAIREIKGHMVSRMHGAATNADGTWNARNFYARANQYATKAPAVFSPSEMRDLQILNRGGNILKMDKSYPGAAAQIQQAGGLRALAAPRIAGAVEGLATGWLGPAKGLLAEATGIAPAMRRGIERVVGGDTAAQREAAIAARITPLNLPGQRGSVRILNNNASGESAASLEAINRGTRNLALVRPDGSSVPVMRDVTQIDRGAPKGHVIVDRDTGEIVSRGADLNQSVANGLRNRFMSQRGSVRVTNPKAEVPLAGAPEGDRPNGTARAAAAAYMKSAQMPYQPLTDYRYVQPEVATDVANAYDAMKHDPTNPKVAAAYSAFKAETLAQYKQMTKAGVKVDLDKSYPYKVPRDVQADVRNNQHMSVFPTDQGFGEPGSVPPDHPLLEKSPLQIGGQDATYNDLFRATHDYYGHVANGNGFRANGEYNAWRAHRQMYSAAARPAMDSETLGQNSWVNSGPHAPTNAGASQTATVYAEQKAGLLPPKVVQAAETGVSADQHHVTNLLTPAERGQLRTDTISRLMAAYHGSPATEEYAAAALAGAAKRGWYRNSAQAIANIFGPDAPRFSALLASMSPQVSVETNFRNALHTFVNWDKAGRPQDPAAIRKIMEDSSQRNAANKGGSNVLEAWVSNAVRSLTTADPGNVQLSGPKVHSFYSNLHGNVNEVTNDAWMAAFAKLAPGKLGGTLNKSGPGKSTSYLALSAKVRDAAKMLSNMTGESWTPREVQETVWSWAKTAYEHAEELGDRSIPELVKNGEITNDLITATPDFHQLFSSPEHRGFLQSSRYADNAERVARWKGQGAVTANAKQTRAAAAKALRPSLLSAAERLEQLRQERNADTGEEAPF